MYFSMGGHPAFACPLIKNGVRTGRRTDCAVKVYGITGDKLQSSAIDMNTGLLSGEGCIVETKQGAFPIVEHMFDKDALVIESQGVTAVGLLDENGVEYARVEAPDCPVWGIWSMPTSDASYICIEPWWGICDRAGYEGTLEERPYTNRLERGKVWTTGFDIILDKSV
jgi:galactose mutarotase-like enzyme